MAVQNIGPACESKSGLLSLITMTKRKAQKGKKAATQAKASTQLSLDFGLPVIVPAQPVDKIITEVEILPPSRQPEPAPADDSAQLLAGQIEHQFLLHRADRYEDRALKTLAAFSVASVLTVLVKAGIPVSQAVLEKLGLPSVTNTRLLAGMLGAVTIVFATVLAYYVLRIRQHSPQMRLRLVKPSIAGAFAQIMLYVGVLLVVAMFVATVLLTWRETLYMVTYVWDRLWYIMDGWEPR